MILLYFQSHGAYLFRQGCVLHSRSWVPDPWQVCPPFCGGGLLQSLTRLNIPPPQDLVQLDTAVQVLQPPLTEKEQGLNKTCANVRTWEAEKPYITMRFDL